jgi:nucleotide-binding universal stress UspA family protein
MRRGVPEKAAKWTGYRRILWPTDFSPLAKAALPHAVGLAAGTGAELVLLHVLPSLAAYAVPDLSGALSVSLQRNARVAAQRQIHRLEKQVKGPNFRTHTVLTEGVPFDQIVRAAKRLRCDLIVLATHGRTGLAHAIMGSVAENVVRRAPCPVLTVRPQKLQRAL